MGENVKEPTGLQAQFDAIVNDASKRLSDSSGESLQDYLNPPIKSVTELEKQLDLHNSKFTQFREKRRKIFSVLAAALDPIEVVGEIVSGAAEDVFKPAEGIFGAVMYLVNGARDVSSTYDAIVELFEQLKDFTSRLEVYVKHELSASLKEKLTTILATLFEVIVLATKEVRRGRFKSYFKSLFGSESPVKPALEKLRALTLGEERQVIAETYGNVSQINVKTDQVQELVNQVNQNVTSLRAEARERTNAVHKDQLKEILDPSPFPEDFFTSFNKSRVDGTGDWILNDECLQAWLNTDTPYLWICGAAGTGKSFLTTRLIAWGSENLSHLAYFYFRDNNPETRSVLQALRDVAYQISESDAFYAKQLLKLLHSGDEIRTVASAYRKLLVQPFKDDLREKNIFIFLDGIDEADQDEVGELLEQLSPDQEDDPLSKRPDHCKVQVALIGRPHLTDTITFALDPRAEGQVVTTLHVTPDRNAKDVTSFIADSVFHSRSLSLLSVEFKYDVIEAMDAQVDGLFILAKFMLAEIARKRHPRTILQSLQSYPKEINGMLVRSLKSLSATLSDDEAKDLNEMLSWVACAKEVLSLGQLEAVLILKFGDPPIRLEETLRGQYACFFELEREDGMTTDDLIKDYERKHRLDNPGRRSSSARRPGSESGSERGQSPRNRGSPRLSQGFRNSDPQVDLARNLSPPGRRPSPRSQLSPRNSPGHSPGRSPIRNGVSPLRNYSPVASPDLYNPVNEMEFQSNKSTTWVSFFHTSVKEFFSNEVSTTFGSTADVPTIGFDPIQARVHILKTCLSIFTDVPWFEQYDLGQGREAIREYAAWYWQEHVAAIDPATVSSADKRDLGPRIYKMLTDDEVILQWSIMYEKSNEGLEVLTDENIKGLRKWMSDPDVLSSLTPESRNWVSKEVNKSPGIFKPIGDLYARAWLSEDFRKYVPTLFCFKIVQAIAFMEEGVSWSRTRIHWADIPVEQRILKAAAWANMKETAHYHRRLGSTYLTNDMHNKALSHYDKALALDHNSVETSGRIAYCLYKDGRMKEALDQTLKCEAIEEETIAAGKAEGSVLKSTKWRLYKDHLLIAECYSELGEIENALKYFRKAVASSKQTYLSVAESFDAEVSYLELLAVENRHGDLVQFLHELHSEVTDTDSERTRLTDILLEEYNKPTVIDWVPRAVGKVGEARFLIEHLQISIELAHENRDALKALYLRHSLGATYAYSRDVEAAISLFEQVSFSEYRPRGNVPTRQAFAMAFQKLASLYKEKVLHAGLKTAEAAEWIKKLERVQIQQSKHQNQDMPLNMVGSDINVAAIYLALFYRLLGRKEEADPLLRVLITDSLEILSDDDAQNDEYALENLLCLLIAADDIENARALSQSMRKIDAQLAPSTTTSSPVLQRIEPKLPEIQSLQHSCAQCLDYISPAEEYSMCEYCMESYCHKCLDKIKQDGNKTSDHRTDLICRSDHMWFRVPPLKRTLHRGEILLVSGGVASFTEWKEALQKRWSIQPV